MKISQTITRDLSEEAKMRLAIIEFYNKVGDATLVCKTFKISRPTFYKWLKRYDPANPFTLEDMSRAPVSRRKSTLTDEKEKRIRKLREKNINLGKDKLQPLYEEIFGEKVSKHHIQKVIRKFDLYPDQSLGFGRSLAEPSVQSSVEPTVEADVKKIVRDLKFPAFTINIDKKFFFTKPVVIGVASTLVLFVIVSWLLLALGFDSANSDADSNAKGSASGETNSKSSNSDTGSSTEKEDLINKISKLIDLPTNEEPTIATVTDKTELADHPFFNQAKNGDKILLYSEARKAILYDPELNKVVNVAPIDLEQ